MKQTKELEPMKKVLMIAALALFAPLANAGDKATTEAAEKAATEAGQKAEISAMETKEAAGKAAEGAQTEAAEMTKEAEGATEAAK